MMMTVVVVAAAVLLVVVLIIVLDLDRQWLKGCNGKGCNSCLMVLLTFCEC